jgi:hypothetical protein
MTGARSKLIVVAQVVTTTLLVSSPVLGQAHRTPAEPEASAIRPVVSGEPRPRADGGYGRFDGDLDIGLLLGAELGTETRRPGARLSLHYFSMAGVAVGYADALDPESPVRRTLTCSVDLRPLFVPRWSNDATRGPALWDLTLDSLSLGAGVFWDQPAGQDFGSQRGFEGSVGWGFPLLGRAQGLWVEARGIARWAAVANDASPRAMGAGLLLVGWHQLVLTPLAKRHR